MGHGHLGQILTNKASDIHFVASHRGNSFGGSNVKLFNFQINDKFPNFLLDESFDYVVWNFPPREGYGETLKAFDDQLDSSIPWIFVSSTSVYLDGKCSESSPKEGNTQNAKMLIAIENELKEMKREVCILYPGGLIDEKRNPAIYISNSVESQGCLSPVNVIYTPDVADFILDIFKKKIPLSDYNLVMNAHPTKQEFYSEMIKKLDLSMPKWKKENSINKIILNHSYSDLSFLMDKMQ